VVFPEGDDAALAEVLARLAGDPAQRAALAARGRDRVLAHYTQERIAEDTYAVYRQILKGTSLGDPNDLSC
jgi:glycosyltransferase involved in cell wall biosynthesis